MVKTRSQTVQGLFVLHLAKTALKIQFDFTLLSVSEVKCLGDAV